MLRSLIFRTLIVNCGINALGLANSILLSHWLGPVGRGEIAAAMLWPMLLVYLVNLGIIPAVSYFAAARGDQSQSIFANALALSLIQSAIALLVGYLALPYLLRSQTANVVSTARLYLLVIPITLSAQYAASILQGRLHLSAFNGLRTIIPLGYLTGTVALQTAGHLTLRNIVMLHLGLAAATWLGGIAVLLKLGVYPSLKVDGALGKEMLKYGGKVHAGDMSGLANQSLDQVLMAAWLPPAYLGLYVVAVSSANLSRVFSDTVRMVATPSITQRQTKSERAAVLQSVFRRYWLLSLFIVAGFAAILPVAIPVVFGVRFSAAIWPAEILLFGMFLAGAREVLAGGAQALGDPWIGSRAQIGGLVVTAGLLYFLLPRIGIMGAALATAAACGIQLIIVVAGLSKAHAIPAKALFRFRAGDLGAALRAFDVFRPKREDGALAQP